MAESLLDMVQHGSNDLLGGETGCINHRRTGWLHQRADAAVTIQPITEMELLLHLHDRRPSSVQLGQLDLATLGAHTGIRVEKKLDRGLRKHHRTRVTPFGHYPVSIRQLALQLDHRSPDSRMLGDLGSRL